VFGMFKRPYLKPSVNNAEIKGVHIVLAISGFPLGRLGVNPERKLVLAQPGKRFLDRLCLCHSSTALEIIPGPTRMGRRTDSIVFAHSPCCASCSVDSTRASLDC